MTSLIYVGYKTKATNEKTNKQKKLQDTDNRTVVTRKEEGWVRTKRVRGQMQSI